MNTSMYEQISDEVSKCLMLNGICLVHSEHKINEVSWRTERARLNNKHSDDVIRFYYSYRFG